jgi:hypothetical protein
MTLAVIDISRPCMEKTLISIEEFPIPEGGKNVRSISARDVCFVAI